MLRAATPDDLRLVSTWVTTHTECALWAGWRVEFPFTVAALAEAIDFAHQGGFVLLDHAAVVAFGQVVPKAAHRAHLARLIVEPGHRGRGLGETLVRGLLEHAALGGHRRASLNVDPANAAAIGLYRKLGFTETERPADEPDPHGSRYMERML